MEVVRGSGVVMDGLAQRSRAIFLLALISGLLGSGFATLAVQKSWLYFFYGFSDGFIVGGLMASYSLYFSRKYIRKKMRDQAFFLKVLLHSIVYVLLFVLGRQISNLIQGRGFLGVNWDTTFYASLVFALIVAIVVNFAIEVSLLLGSQVTLGFLKGTYSSPIEEERIFLFIDLASSTTIAEKIGNKKFLKLLSDFFYDLGQSVLENGGEIYKYIGDEAIISWKFNGSASVLSSLKCFYRFVELMDLRKDYYVGEYGFVPQYRGGLHGGLVISGELGEAKKEIAYLGDVVNTAARIMDKAKEKKTPLVSSGYIVQHLKAGSQKSFRANLLDSAELKGKSEKLELYEISRAL